MRFRFGRKFSLLKPDITPLIDVVFLLLIFFMLGSQFVYSTSIKVELPKAKTGEINNDRLVTLAIDKHRGIFLDDKQITMRDVHTILGELKDGKLAISADKEAPFGSVIEIWDAARQKKIESITIQTTS